MRGGSDLDWTGKQTKEGERVYVYLVVAKLLGSVVVEEDDGCGWSDSSVYFRDVSE